MKPTVQQMSRALAAYDAMASEWKIRRIGNYGLGHDAYVLEHSPPYAIAEAAMSSAAVFAYKFEGPDAFERAKFMKHDKCLREVLRAVAVLDETDPPHCGKTANQK